MTTPDRRIEIEYSLRDREYRHALAIDHVNTTLALQIRKLRESKDWRQVDLAREAKKKQEAISQWEDPDYGSYNLNTLRSLAAAFDVALLVKFIPFGELVDDMTSLSEVRLLPRSYKEEQKAPLAKGVDKQGNAPVGSPQKLMAATNSSDLSPNAASTPVVVALPGTPDRVGEREFAYSA